MDRIERMTVMAAAVLCAASLFPRRAAAHNHVAPHQGTLVELGEEVGHLEVLLNPTDGTMTIYVLDGEAEQPVRVEQPTLELQIAPHPDTPEADRIPLWMHAVENPLTGEMAGDTSQFAGKSDALKGLTAFDGEVDAIELNGQRFTDVAFHVASPAAPPQPKL